MRLGAHLSVQPQGRGRTGCRRVGVGPQAARAAPMMGPRAALRTVRYALPHLVERVLPGPGPAAAVRRCRKLDRSGLSATLGYFQAGNSSPEDIVAANL